MSEARAAWRAGRGLDSRIPFASKFSSLVAQAETSLVVPRSIATEVAGAATQELVGSISHFAAPAALELFRAEGGGHRGHYQAFVSDGAATDLLAEYPGLAAVIDVVTTRWVANTNRLFERASADLRDLTRGRATGIVGLQPALGDPHHGRQTVAAVTTSSGERFFYKPRPLKVERRFFDMGEDSGAILPAAAPDFVLRDGYGWMSEVAPGAVADPDAYWFQSGRLLRLLQLFGTFDLHASNVVATSQQAVPVDLECSLAPELLRPELLVGRAHSWLRASPLRCGLLPGVATSGSSLAVDRSGLAGRPGMLTGGRSIRWSGLGTDEIGWSWQIERIPKGSNLARGGSGAVLPINLNGLIDGYLAEDRRWSIQQLPRWQLASLGTRVLVRSTEAYGRCLSRVQSPDLLRDDHPMTVAAVSLPPLDHELTVSLDAETAGRIRASEVASLERLDVPTFGVAGSSINLDDKGPPIDIGCVTGMARAAHQLDDRSAAHVQLDTGVIRMALAGRTHGWPRAPRPEPSPRLPMAVADALCDSAVPETSGRLVWLEAVPGAGSPSGWQPSVGSDGLYFGSSGIALFLAVAASVSGDRRYADTARLAMAPSDSSVGDASLARGWSGQAWAEAMMSTLIDAPDLAVRARTTMSEGLTADIAPGDGLSFLEGWGGVVLAATGVLDHAGDDRLAEQLAVFGGRYLGELHRQEALDPPPPQLRRLGMAHGSFGITHALGALTAMTGLTASCRFEQRVEWEEAQLARSRARRMAQAGQSEADHRWCRGGSGYLLGRSQAWFRSRRCSIEASLGKLTTELRESEPEADPALCCGTAGQLEALMAVRNLEPSLVPAPAAQQRTRAIEDAVGHATSNGQLPPHLGLFRGIAGAALSLLRSQHDEPIPNPLTLT